MSERELVIEIKKQITKQFKNVWIHKKPSASRSFRDETIKIFGSVPLLQPEFDLVIKTNDDKLNAIEVKYLTRLQNGFNLPFYEGIGQALVLSRFGFDHVGLWLFVDERIAPEVLNHYGAQSWYFVRNELNLPLEYSYFKVIKKRRKLIFTVMQYEDDSCGYEIANLNNNNFQVTWKYPNPLATYPERQKLRTIVENYLLMH